MYTKGKLNCSVSEEISNKIFHYLLKQNIPVKEALPLSQNYKSLKDIKPFLVREKPLNLNLDPHPANQAEPIEPNNIEADLSSFSEAKQKIYKKLLKHNVEHNKALEIIFFCDNEEEAFMNANIDVKGDYKQNMKQAGSYLYKKSGKEIEKCSICLDFLEENDEMKALPCFHKFHLDFIDVWIESGKNNCPECLAEIKYN